MGSTRLFRVIIPVSNIEDAATFYSAVLEQPGRGSLQDGITLGAAAPFLHALIRGPMAIPGTPSRIRTMCTWR